MTLLDDDETMFIEVEPKLLAIEVTLVKWVDDKRKKISYYISFDELHHFKQIFTYWLEKLRKYK